MLFRPGPTPRLQGRYLVVAPGTRLPRICVRTGATDDLIEVDEDVRTSRSVERLVGALGALWSHEDGRLCYYLSRREVERLQRWRRLCTRAILGAILALVIAAVLRSGPATTAAFGAVCTLTAAFWMLPTPINVAAVWGGQIFLLKMRPEIVERVLRNAPR